MEEGGGSAWAIKPGTAWAEEVEAEEAKHGPRGIVSEEAFPSLGESSKQPGGKSSKKGKGTKLSLSEFSAFPVGRSRQLSDKEILLQLPKGSSGLPKEERDSKALGGGFKDYGGNRQGGGFGDRREGREEREPSRADAAGDWGAERKFVPSDSSRGGGSSSFGSGGFRDREGGFGERRGGGGFSDRPPREERPISEADTVDDWGANRKYTPSAGADSSRGGGGGGFRDRERPAGAAGPPRFSDEPSRADTGDWGARRSTPDGERPGAPGAGGARRGYGFSDQPLSQADIEDKWSHRAAPAADAAGGEGRAAPAERPKLKLAPRTKPLPEQQQQQANGTAASSPRAGSEADSTGSGQQQQQAPKPRKSNPFGAARPREEVLKEKGIDYQKEELKLEHGEVLRDATPEEVEMEAEVEGLRKQLEELTTATPDETDTISDLKKELDEKERALYTLQAKLDDELRYSKHRPERERDGPARSGNSATAEDMSGFEPVRNARRERSGTAAAGPDAAAAAAAGGSKEQAEAGAAPAAGGGGGGAWGKGGGGGSFRDRERDGGRGSGGSGGFGGSFRDRDGGRGGGPPPGRGERRQNESLAGRAGGGW